MDLKPPRPTALPVSPANIPAALMDLDQWVTWRYVWLPKEEKWTKVPFNARTGKAAKSTDPTTWSPCQKALAAYQTGDYDGIGFVLTEDLGIVGIDLDHCRNADTGAIDSWALDIVHAVTTYTEVSPSGTGLRLFSRGTLPPKGRKKGDIELYTSGRYLTITGCHLEGTPLTIEPRQAEITALHTRSFGTPDPQPPSAPETTGASGTLSDDALIEKALSARNSGKFAQLWAGDTRGYASPSNADEALSCCIAFYSRDATQIDRLFRRSQLMRPKWDEKRGAQSYGARTVARALEHVTEYWTPPPSSAGWKLKGFPPAKLTLADKLAGLTRDPDTGELRTDEQAASQAFEWAQEGEHLTDLGNARRLVRSHGQDLRYCDPWKTWLTWQGTHWQPDQSGAVMRAAKATVASIYAEAAQAPDEDARRTIAKHAMKSEAGARLREIIALAHSEPGIPVLPKDLDRDPWLLNCLNGTVDLRTGELRPHRREDLLTKLAPVRYDPQARSEVWDTFLARILPAAELRAFVQRALGYSIVGVTHEEVLFFPFGPTATGKSTLLCAVSATLGEYAQTADFATFLARDRVMGGPRNDIAEMDGRRFVMSVEVEEGTKLAEALITQLTGGDLVRARFLYQESFEFHPTFTLWLAANHRPRVRDDDDAIWRRILQIPFDVQIPKAERDPEVKATLRDPARSGAAILAWMVHGCLAWQREGLGVPKAVEDTTQDYRDEMDPLRDFLADRCLVNSTEKATKGELWGSYEGWAKATGVRGMSSRQFIDRLRRQGFDETRTQTARFWIGVGLRNDTNDTNDTKQRNFQPSVPHDGKLREMVSFPSFVSFEREPGEEG